MQTTRKYQSLDEVPIIDLDEALRQVNAVRARVGWEPFDELPKAVPNSSCACVLGKSWKVTIGYEYSEEYFGGDGEDVERLNGTVEFTSRNRDVLQAIADEFNDGYTYERGAGWYTTLPADLPLLRWMIEFDASRIPELIAADRYL